MGTFKLSAAPGFIFTNLAHLNTGVDSWTAVLYQDGKFIFCGTLSGDAEGTYFYRCSMNTTGIVLDGDTTNIYNINSLPAGFTVTQATARAYISQTKSLAIPTHNAWQWFFENFPYGAPFTLGASSIATTVTTNLLDGSGAVPQMLVLTGLGFGLNLTIDRGGVGGTNEELGIDLLEITGTYTIETVWWANPETENIQYSVTNPGSSWTPLVDIPKYNPDTGDVDLTPPVDLGNPWVPWIPINPIEFDPNNSYITPNIIPFIPIPFSPTAYVPIPFGPPTTFIPTPFIPISPFIPLTLVEDAPDEPDSFILITPTPQPTDNGYQLAVGGAGILVFIGSPSGIYTLVPGQTYDTLYDRTGAVSVNVKIPNPFIETGFLGE